MVEKSIFDAPEVQEYIREKEEEIQQQYRKTSLQFDSFYAFNLIYHSNALKLISERAEITKTDFIVLSGCFLVASKRQGYITTREVRKLLIGVYWNEIYRSITNLLGKEFLRLSSKKGKERVFMLTPKALYAIKIYSGYIGWYTHKYGKLILVCLSHITWMH